MSRADVLVDADWVEAHLDDPKVVLVEVDEDTSAYEQNHIRNAIRIDWSRRAPGQGPLRLHRQGRLREAPVGEGHRQRRHRRLLRRQQQLVRGLRVLVLQAVRPREPAPARRRPQEVGARRARARRRGPDPSGHAVQGQGAGPAASARSATTSSTASATSDLVDVRSPDEYTGKLLAPAHLPQEQAHAAGHVPTARNIPWSQGRERRRHLQVRRRAARALHRGGRRPRQGPRSRTAASASVRRTPGSR